MDEIVTAFNMFNIIGAVNKMDTSPNIFHYYLDSFSFLSIDQQDTLQEYYDLISEFNERKLEVMARENSIQLVLQTALLGYQFIRPPLYELNYSAWTYPEVVWISSRRASVFE